MPDRTATSTIFPLPCSAFEKYMLFDDRPSHPMVSFLETAFRGRVEQALFERAGQIAVARHPLLEAQLVGRSPRDWHWDLPASRPGLLLHVIASPAQLPAIGEESLDLRRQSGLRAWLLPSRESTRLYLQVHHAAADALGMLTFLGDWLAAYHELIQAPLHPLTLPPPTWGRLPFREDLTGLRSPYRTVERWRRIGRLFVGQRATPLFLPPHTGDDPLLPSSLPGHCHVSLTGAEVGQIKQLARCCGATVGDCVLWAAFQACARWNHRIAPGAARRQDAYRIVVPVNRRSPDEVFLSATNKISYAVLTRQAPQLVDPHGALRSIAQEMNFVRQHRTQIFNLLKTLRLLDRLGCLERIVKTFPCFATLVVSNLGDLNQHFRALLPERGGEIHAGNLVLDSIRCAPPRRIGTHTTLVCFRFAGELHLVSRGDGRGFGALHTQSFLESVRDALRDLIATAAPAVRSPLPAGAST